MSYVKIGIAIAIFAAGSLAGYSIATNKAEREMGRAIKVWGTEREKLDTIISDLRSDLATERTDRALEIAEVNHIAALSLADAVSKGQAKEQELRSQLKKAEKNYRDRIKELEDAKTKADAVVDDVGPAGGLWIDVEAACAATGNSDRGADVPSPGGPTIRSPATSRCRIATPTAKALVKIVADADAKTQLLNKCVDALVAQTSVLNPGPDITNLTNPTNPQSEKESK